MSSISAESLAAINSLPKLITFLRDQLDWEIDSNAEADELLFEYDPDELGLKEGEIAKVREIQQLRPLVTDQPWGIFFVSFEDKGISVTVLRRLLRALVVKKRAGSQDAGRQTWNLGDLMFIASFGESGSRELAFARFSDAADTGDLAPLQVLGWNARDTKLHNEYVAQMLGTHLRWPNAPDDQTAWRAQWSGAFEIGIGQVIRTSKELAVRLAALAANVRARVNQILAAEAASGRMQRMLGAFRKNLIHHLDEDGFADMFAQTIAYGLLTARISKMSGDPSEELSGMSGGLVADNVADMVPRTNPFLRELFESFLKLGGRDKRSGLDFDELGIRDVVDMLNQANMAAVLRDFDDRNPREDPVIHFYERFLTEYDPEKRIQRGVFYTPRPVVQFIVRNIDRILQDEFGLELGLADTATWAEVAARDSRIEIPPHVDPDTPFIQILDPATGTGTFLVEVIELVHSRMVAHWRTNGLRDSELSSAWNNYVREDLLPRLNAFELMMAPYAIAHMKVGLKLHSTGYRFETSEPARILLTNALEPPRDLDMQFDFMAEALAHEARSANSAKAETAFTVIIGNPPYSGHSQNNNLREIVELVYDYKKDWPELLKPGQAKWLQDDYVKFIRFAQYRIDATSCGVLGFITNHSYFDNPTFKGMRSKLKQSFDQIRILDLHGNVKKKEKAPDGTPDGGVFEGVAQGVGITNAIKLDGFGTSEQLWRDDLFGSVAQKLDYLVHPDASIVGRERCKISEPECFFHSIDSDLKFEWDGFPSVPQIFAPNGDPAPGVVTTHDQFAVSFTPDEQAEKIEWLIATPNEAAARKRFQLCKQNQWDYETAKRRLSTGDWKNQIASIAYRPFDLRTTVYDNQVAVHLRDRVTRHMIGGGNLGLVTTRQRSQATGDWGNAFVVDRPIESTSISNKTKEINYLFPLWLKPNSGDLHPRPNVDRLAARDFGETIGLAYKDGAPRRQQTSMGENYRRIKPEQLSLEAATWDGHGDLEITFGPRDLFDWIYAVLHSPSYRSRYAEFLKSDFPRIPTPKNRASLADLVPLGRDLVALHLLRPDEAPALEKPEVRFAGSGEARVEKGYPKYDNGKVMINDARWFEDVPREIWEFHVGGYQVCQKWLKDRAGKGGKNPSLGRVLSDEDIIHYRRVVVALTETRRIMSEIDRIIDENGGWPDAFDMPPPPPPTIEEIIQADEGQDLEFKSTLQFDLKEGTKSKSVRKATLKTVVAFLNSGGGSLAIGVADDKEIVGLEPDFSTMSEEKRSQEWFQQTLVNFINDQIGTEFAQSYVVRFASHEGKQICIIDVNERGPTPAYLKAGKGSEFYVRTSNLTKQLKGDDITGYVRAHWPGDADHQ